jgi:TonB-linked SusC/RagA family outer membrane protein
MNAYDFARTINETSTAPPFSESDLQKFRTQSTDWQDEIYRNALSKNFQLSVTGGNKDIRYFISANRSDQDGILLNSDYNRTTLRSNLDANLTRKLSVKLNLSASQSKGHNNSYAGWKQEPQTQAPIWDPTTPVYNEDGTYNLKSQYGSIWNQPVAVANAASRDNNLNDYIGNLSLTYEFIKDLKLIVRAGIESQENLSRNLDVPDYTSGSTINAGFSTRRFTLFQNSNILTYTKKINNVHALTLTGIYEQQSRVSNNIYGGSSNLVSSATGYYNLGLGTPTLGSDYANESIQSYLGRINYSFLDKYLLTVSYRYDGSSKFAKKNQYSGFPSLAFAWRVSKESFLSNLDFLTDLKIRASYGKTGNQAISPYSTLTLSNTGAFYSWDGKTITPGVSIGSPANENLKWETTSSLNGGIDATLFNNRLSFTLDVYHKSTNDLLLAVPLPQFMGGGSYLKNIGNVENKGIEIILGGTPVSVKDFKWVSSFNITFNKNKVKDLGEGALKIYTGYNSFNGANPTYIIEKGQSLGQILGNESLGTWKSSEAQQAAVYGAKPGDEKFADLNKDGKINGDDQTVLGNSMPEYTFGFSNDFSYKNFSLNIFVFGIRGFQLWNANKAYTMGGQGDARNATNKEYLNRWKPGNETNIPVNNINVQSGRFVEDGSFIKVRNVNLSYRFPRSMVGKMKLSSIDLYVAGQNLFTITKYKGYDSEATSMFSGGGGDAIGPIDWGTIPNPRTFTLGLKIGF